MTIDYGRGPGATNCLYVAFRRRQGIYRSLATVTELSGPRVNM